MSRLIEAVVLAVMLTVIGGSSAVAATGPAMITSTNPIGTPSNTAAISGNSVNYPAHTFVTGATTIRCDDAKYPITMATTNTIVFDGQFDGCSATSSGVSFGEVTVHHRCPATLSFHNATFNDATGATTGGTHVLHCTMSFTVPSVGCTMHFPPQTREGFSAQNIDMNGNNSTAAHPWGSKLIQNVNYTYTRTGSCPGLAFFEHGTINHTGTVAVRNLWFML